MSRHIKRGGRIWIRVFPDKPVSQKPAEVRMGNGKGNPEYFVTEIQPGKIVFEMDGVSETLAKEAFALAAAPVCELERLELVRRWGRERPPRVEHNDHLIAVGKREKIGDAGFQHFEVDRIGVIRAVDGCRKKKQRESERQDTCLFIRDPLFIVLSHIELESLQKLDQGQFVVVAERDLVFILEVAGAEIMAAIDDEVGALAELE